MDVTAPTVTDVAPNDDQTDVGLKVDIKAYFSEEMDPSSLRKATFKLYRKYNSGEWVEVAGTVSYDSALKRAVFDPDNDLASGRSYKAVVETGTKDEASNALAAEKVWTFKTRNQSSKSAVGFAPAMRATGFRNIGCDGSARQEAGNTRRRIARKEGAPPPSRGSAPSLGET